MIALKVKIQEHLGF